MTMLTVKNLRKRFGDNEVLKGIDMTLEKGEVLSILGSSGGGKTTFLRCLNFLETADEGEICVAEKTVFSAKEGEKPVFAPEAQLSLGLVFQQFNLFPQYSVMGNLTLAPLLRLKQEEKERASKAHLGKLARLFKKSDMPLTERMTHEEKKKRTEEIFARARTILESVGLSEKADSYPCEISGGQQQRVAIARALMLEPEILCFDEPTSALDPELTGEVLRVIKSLANEDRTMIIVTHEMEFARNVSDKIIFMADGVIEEMGTPEEIFDHPKSEKLRAFLRKDNEID